MSEQELIARAEVAERERDGALASLGEAQQIVANLREAAVWQEAVSEQHRHQVHKVADERDLARAMVESYRQQRDDWYDKAEQLRQERDEAVKALSALVCEDPRSRDMITAPEDPAVEALCLVWGYGAVMDSAMRLWHRRHPGAAFTVCGCRTAAERAWDLLVRMGKEYRP